MDGRCSNLINDILRSRANSEASSSRGSRGREPIPLTLEILHLLDKMKLDKGKQARLLTKHLTRQRLFPSKDQELHSQLEKLAHRKTRQQHESTKRTTNKEAAAQSESDKAAHEETIVTHLANMAKETSIAARAIEEHAQATSHKAAEEAINGANAFPVRDRELERKTSARRHMEHHGEGERYMQTRISTSKTKEPYNGHTSKRRPTTCG